MDRIEIVKAKAAMVGIDPNLLIAIGMAESGLKDAAVSSTTVQGAFQITGSTWKMLRPDTKYSTDLGEQAYTAALLIKKMQQAGFDTPELIYANYNAGPKVASEIKKEMMRNGGNFSAAVTATMDRLYPSGVYYQSKDGKTVVTKAAKIKEIIGGASRVHGYLKDGVKYSVTASSGDARTATTSGTKESAANNVTGGATSNVPVDSTSTDAVTSFFDDFGAVLPTLKAMNSEEFSTKGAQWLRKTFKVA